MANNPYVNKVQLANGTTLIDITDTTAVASDVASGKYFYDATGAKVEGTASGGGGTSWETVYSGVVNVQDWGDVVNYATVSGYFNTHDDFEYNKHYRITWINDQYECVATELIPSAGDGYVVGNGELLDGTTGNNEPFAMIRTYQGVNLLIVTTSSTGNKTLVIEKQVSGGGGGATLIEKSITANGTYNASDDNADGYSKVTVNVSSGGGKNVQVAHGTKRVASQTYTDVGYEITVAKTGTYNVYWAGWRSSTSGTNGAQLYVNGTASGDAVTTFDGTWTNVQNGSRTSVSLTANDKVTLRARSRGTSYYMYIFFLSIEEV